MVSIEFVFIEISNTAEDVDTADLSTTKPQQSLHGYGIHSIRSSSKRLGGTLHFKYDSGVFVMKLLIKTIKCIKTHFKVHFHNIKSTVDNKSIKKAIFDVLNF